MSITLQLGIETIIMDSKECMEPLLVRNEDYSADYEDSSSGYDSSDVSDTESVTSVESRDSHSNLASFCRPEQEVMNFRSTSSLCANLRLILQMPDLCDVTFLVGPRDVPVHGVRAILGTRSCIFYQLILKHQALLNNQAPPTPTRPTNDRRPAGPNTTRGQGPVAPNTTRGQGPVGSASSRGQGYKKLSIPVKKYEPVVFEKLVEFVHCGNVNITEETVIGLYCGAAKFRLADLSAACQDFVWRCLQGGRADNLLAFAERNSHHKAAHPLLEKIRSFRDDGKTDKAEIPPRDLLD